MRTLFRGAANAVNTVRRAFNQGKNYARLATGAKTVGDGAGGGTGSAGKSMP